jgi:hypothetical protein
MSATPAAHQPPQRACPRCSSIARTADAHCPFCGASYRRRSQIPAIAALLLLFTAASLGGTAAMLSAFGDDLDRELDEEVEVVQEDFDRDVRRLERRIERELDERLGPPTGP